MLFPDFVCSLSQSSAFRGISEAVHKTRAFHFLHTVGEDGIQQPKRPRNVITHKSDWHDQGVLR